MEVLTDFSAARLRADVLSLETRRMPSEPEPLRRRMQASKQYPLGALGGLIGEAVSAVQRVMQAPLALVAQSFLAASSLAAQPHADVEIDGRRYPLSLWMISVAESGERKSAVDGIALSAHKRIERESLERAEREQPAFEARDAAWEAAMRQAKNKKSMVEIQDAIKACGQRPTPPPRGILLAAEPTVEALQKIYLSGVPSLGLFSDEGATFFGGHSMSADHMMRTVGALSKLWDDGTSDRLRATDGIRKLYGRRLGMHMLTQPIIAEKLLSDPLLSGQGFLARCLLAWPETTAGTRSYVEANPYNEFAVRRFGDRMLDLLRRAAPGENGEIDPRRLQLSSPAKQTWIAAYEQIEKMIAPGGLFSTIRPWASKAAEQILRVAGVLALVEDPDAERIESPGIKAASEIVSWHIGEVLRLVDVARIPDEIRHAEAVLEWCRTKKTFLVDAKTLMNRGPNCIRDKDSLAAAMNVLVDTGWASCDSGVIIDSRKVRRAWKIHDLGSQESQKSPGEQGASK